jgi:hypothetical protein
MSAHLYHLQTVTGLLTVSARVSPPSRTELPRKLMKIYVRAVLSPLRFGCPCFAALLGEPEHARWLTAPVTAVRQVQRRYVSAIHPRTW